MGVLKYAYVGEGVATQHPLIIFGGIMIKILHVISDKNIGGAGKLLLNLLKKANRELFDISVILLKGSALKKKVDELGIKTILLENFGLGTLIREIKCQSPHIVHTHAAGMARVAARLCGRIITVNTKHCSNEVIKKAPFLKRNAVRLLDIIFTDFTISTADYVRETLLLSGILPYKTAVIVNGSHALNEFSYDEIGRIKESLGYSKSDFTMLARQNVKKLGKICEVANKPMDYETYIQESAQTNVLKREIEFVSSLRKIAVLNTSVFFALDYYGNKGGFYDDTIKTK